MNFYQLGNLQPRQRLILGYLGLAIRTVRLSHYSKIMLSNGIGTLFAFHFKQKKYLRISDQ